MKILLFIAAAMAALAPASTDAVVAPAPTSPEGEALCSRGICGCWRDAALSYWLQINNAQGAPVEGVEGICQGETEAIARSSATGLLTFDLATQQSPGCGYRRCKALMLLDPEGRYASQQATAGITGSSVILEPRPR